jgi:hypothetical protein
MERKNITATTVEKDDAANKLVRLAAESAGVLLTSLEKYNVILWLYLGSAAVPGEIRLDSNYRRYCGER